MLTKPLETETNEVWIELRQQANYWKSQHARAVEREAVWKNKAQELEKTIYAYEELLKELLSQQEKLKAQIAWLQQQLFGQKSEQSKASSEQIETSDVNSCCDNPKSSEEKRQRGQQRGAKGSGRKLHKNLPAESVFHDLSEDKKQCSICKKPYRVFPTTEDSEEIHIETRIVRRIHKRIRYIRSCNCESLPRIITAPSPAKLIPKGMFSTNFWTHILLEKFLFQRPLFRILQTFKMEGLFLSQGTITGGLQKIEEMLRPLYTQILQRSRSADHWHMDETHWKMFVIVDDKTGYKWWLWVVATKDTCVYILDTSRSANVPENLLGEEPKGVISADRYSAYKSLLSKSLLIAYCWAHVRRDYIKIRDTHLKLCLWAESWIIHINELFQLNKKRLEVLSIPDKFNVFDQSLRQSISRMKENYEKELNDDNLHLAQRKVLESLKKHWSGLVIFVDQPFIPMDNNLSERKLRNPVIGRKNYYGCSSLWSGKLAATSFTLFQTLLLNNINPKKFLRA